VGTRGTVLVTDGEQRSALAVVRSLGRAGYRVVVCSSGGRSLAGGSRFTAREVAVADPLTAPATFVDQVEHITRENDVDTILPISEASALVLLASRERFRSTVLGPSLAAFRAACDKSHVVELARSLGIRVPQQHIADDREALMMLAVQDLAFPLVLKPARSVAGDGPGVTNGELKKFIVRHIADRKALRTAATEIDGRAFPVLLQERIIGAGIGVFVLLWKGEVLASFAHRRLREKPPAGGVSVYCESVSLDRDLLDRSVALLRALDWEGVAMVEYKMDDDTNEPVLMEINGRFWGSLQLAIDAGVDFPALLVNAASGSRVDPVRQYRLGTRSRWWWGDVDHLLIRMRRTRSELALPPDAPTQLGAIRDFVFASGRRTRNDVFRLSDPVPFVRETLQWFAKL
jgi:predicted ATP-grasp superfamily ATP-dependent carboligase